MKNFKNIIFLVAAIIFTLYLMEGSCQCPNQNQNSDYFTMQLGSSTCNCNYQGNCHCLDPNRGYYHTRIPVGSQTPSAPGYPVMNPTPGTPGIPVTNPPPSIPAAAPPSGSKPSRMGNYNNPYYY